MAVVIEKMDLPTRCTDCDFATVEKYKDTLWRKCEKTGDTCTMDAGHLDRMESCPMRAYTPFHDVYKELIGCNMFAGKYDAKNARKDFMYGIATVMEWIAYSAGKYDEFESMFYKNMEKSEEKTEPCDEWIPVSKKLPEAAGQQVLVTAMNAFGQKSVFMAFQGYGDMKWHSTDGTLAPLPRTEVRDCWKILAWKHAPEEYKGEENENA